MKLYMFSVCTMQNFLNDEIDLFIVMTEFISKRKLKIISKQFFGTILEFLLKSKPSTF